MAHAAAAPVAMNLAMSNAGLDVGPGIGLEGRAKPTAAPVKVASAISEARTRKTREEAGGGGADAPCEEEPTKPEAIVQTPTIDYTLYPQAQADGIEGKFKARLTIDADGQVESVTVARRRRPGLRRRHRRRAQALALQAGDGLRQAGRRRHRRRSRRGSSSATERMRRALVLSVALTAAVWRCARGSARADDEGPQSPSHPSW